MGCKFEYPVFLIISDNHFHFLSELGQLAVLGTFKEPE